MSQYIPINYKSCFKASLSLCQCKNHHNLIPGNIMHHRSYHSRSVAKSLYAPTTGTAAAPTQQKHVRDIKVRIMVIRPFKCPFHLDPKWSTMRGVT